MRNPFLSGIALILLLTACGGQPAGDQPEVASDTVAEMPNDDVHSQATAGAMGGPMGGINKELHLTPEIAEAWSGVRVRLIDSESGASALYDVPLGTATPLGDSGLILTARTFVPDFVMDEGGITSRSADPNNPAAQVLVTEEGAEDYEGWLFAAMPGIHPYPHERFQVLLVEGIPAQ
jgi:hypothetical protein